MGEGDGLPGLKLNIIGVIPGGYRLVHYAKKWFQKLNVLIFEIPVSLRFVDVLIL